MQGENSSMKIVAKKENSNLFTKLWLEYQSNNNTGINYSLDLIGYYLVTNKLTLKHDESFVVIDNKDMCVGICFLPIYIASGKEYANGYSPITKSQKVLTRCFEYIDIVAYKYKLSKVVLSIDPCCNLNEKWPYNYLRSYDYIDCTSNGYVFELNKSPGELFKKFNSSSRRLIRRSLKKGCEFKVYNFDNIVKNIFLKYKEYHFICAGRQTRSDKSFDNMFESINIIHKGNFNQKSFKSSPCMILFF